MVTVTCLKRLGVSAKQSGLIYSPLTRLPCRLMLHILIAMSLKMFVCDKSHGPEVISIKQNYSNESGVERRN